MTKARSLVWTRRTDLCLRLVSSVSCRRDRRLRQETTAQSRLYRHRALPVPDDERLCNEATTPLKKCLDDSREKLRA